MPARRSRRKKGESSFSPSTARPQAAPPQASAKPVDDAIRGRAASSERTAREVSAGGVVVRDGKVLTIVPTRRAADGLLVRALPKGHLDEGETPEQAAEREVREETGVSAELVGELGEVRYWYVRGGRRIPKSVFFYLFCYLSGDVADHDDEVLEAIWMEGGEALVSLTYEGEREMVRRALALQVEG